MAEYESRKINASFSLVDYSFGLYYGREIELPVPRDENVMELRWRGNSIENHMDDITPVRAGAR